MTDRLPDRSAIERFVAEFDALGRSRVRDANDRLVVPVPATALLEQPELTWNGFAALMGYSGLDELHSSQQPAWHAFQYDSEVQNGGHELYFDVRAGVGLTEAIGALLLIGAAAHAKVLTAAVGYWRSQRLSAHAAELDTAFAEAQPPLADVLEAYVRAHRDWFVEAR